MASKNAIPIGAPERIYLQISDEDLTPADIRETKWEDLYDVTWHSGPVFDSDIEYRLVKTKRKVKK